MSAVVVVLIAPPGSGKSTVGEELRRRGLRWRDVEAAIFRRWGCRENFVANKTEGLRLLHEEILELINSDGPPVVIETTGLSDSVFLDHLSATHEVFTVRLEASEDVAMARVADREHGRHLTDDPDANRAIWRAFSDTVASNRRADAVIDTERTSPQDAAAAIIRGIARAG